MNDVLTDECLRRGLIAVKDGTIIGLPIRVPFQIQKKVGDKMRFAAKDGSMHPSQKQAFDAGQKVPDQVAPPADDAQGAPPIEDNPDAMQMVDQLKQMGYTADDVAQAMNDDGGQAPAGGAPLAIPGAQ